MVYVIANTLLITCFLMAEMVDSVALRFVLLGDWGKYSASRSKLPRSILRGQKTYYQTNVAKSMDAYCSEAIDGIAPCSFIVALGDNFYDYGIQSTTDSRWAYVWKDIYHGVYSSLNIKWYPVFGNHDYGFGLSGISAQIDRTTSGDDDLWTMPSTNYTQIFSIGGGATLQIVFIDTTTLAPSENSCCNENGGVSVSEQSTRIASQLSNIIAILEKASIHKPTWLLVAGHYPVYSSGSHSDTQELISYLDPLLSKYNVHAYFSGHDHISEHLQKDGMHYFVSGAGSMADYLGSSSSAASLTWAGAGFSAFTGVIATPDTLEISFIDTDNTVVYSYSLNNPNTLSNDDDSSTNGGGSEFSQSNDNTHLAEARKSFPIGVDKWIFLGMGAFVFVALCGLLKTINGCRSNQSITRTQDPNVFAALQMNDPENGKIQAITQKFSGKIPEADICIGVKSSRAITSNESFIARPSGTISPVNRTRKFNSIA